MGDSQVVEKALADPVGHARARVVREAAKVPALEARIIELEIERDEHSQEVNRLKKAELDAWVPTAFDMVANKLGFDSACGLGEKVEALRKERDGAFAVVKMMKEALEFYDHCWGVSRPVANELSRKARSSEYVNMAIDAWYGLLGERDALAAIVAGPGDDAGNLSGCLKAWAMSLRRDMPKGCDQLAVLLDWLGKAIGEYVKQFEEEKEDG